MSARTMSVAVVCGVVAAACAGADTPSRDDDLEAAIAQAYANGVGASGSGPGPVGGSGGRAPAGGAGGGASQGGSNATSGAGGEPAGTGGTAPEGGAGGSGSGDCNGAAVLVAKCSGPTCHGDGTPYSAFAVSEAEALNFIDQDPSSSGQCSDNDPIITAGSPANSLIVQKLDGSMPCGSPMPLGPPLSAAEVQCIEDWIGSLE